MTALANIANDLEEVALELSAYAVGNNDEQLLRLARNLWTIRAALLKEADKQVIP